MMNNKKDETRHRWVVYGFHVVAQAKARPDGSVQNKYHLITVFPPRVVCVRGVRCGMLLATAFGRRGVMHVV